LNLELIENGWGNHYNCITDHIVNISQNFNSLKELYDLLKTPLEKNMFVFSIFKVYNSISNDMVNFDIIACPETKKFTQNNRCILDTFNDSIKNLYYSNTVFINYDSISKIMKIFDEKQIYKYIGIHGSNMHLNIFIPYVKYFRVRNFNSVLTLRKNIKYNKILFYLRTFIRKKCSERKIKKRIRIEPLLRELKALKPNSTKPVFNKGTDKYYLDRQNFNNIPPYNLYPNQIQYIKCPLVIKEKSDGTLVKKMTSRLIHPNIIINEEFKAEYIEDLDLFLIFDIDLKMSIQDRYSYLRKLHPNTRNFVNKGTNIKDKINKERDNLKLFLQEDYDSVRWYPKASFYCNFISIDLQNWVVNIVNDIDKNLNKWLCNDGPVQNDGLIITPLINFIT
jgi:hypothetical protein